MEEKGIDKLPTVKKIRDDDHHDLVSAVYKYHGGMKKFKEILNYLEEGNDQMQISEPIIKYFTRRDLCDLFHISLPTIYAWTRKGLLNPKKVGARVLYEERDVMELLNNNKRDNEKG